MRPLKPTPSGPPKGSFTGDAAEAESPEPGPKRRVDRRHPRAKDHLLRKQLLTISSRAQNEHARRTNKRANSIQILDDKRKKGRKRIGDDEKKIISISLKDNFIREREQRRRVEESAKSPFYSKYVIEHGQFYRVPDKLGQYQSNFSNLFERKKGSLGEGGARKAETAKKVPRNARERETQTSHKKAHRKRKRLFENLRMGKRAKDSGSKKSWKLLHGASDLRPYSAPIDGRRRADPQRRSSRSGARPSTRTGASSIRSC